MNDGQQKAKYEGQGNDNVTGRHELKRPLKLTHILAVIVPVIKWVPKIGRLCQLS